VITKTEVMKNGYTVLPKGGWIYINPEIIPHDWDDLCKDFGVDPSAKGAYLCVAGFKEDV